jgi:choline dehydrogenase-like flavoprotein
MNAFPPSYSDTLFDEACEALGIKLHSVPQARNVEPYAGRSQCLGFSTCIPVCPSGAKYSGDVHVRQAEEYGATVIDRAPVQQLETDRAGETVTEAVYATPDGETYRQAARRFVLACGAVEIPRLLLLSKSETNPAGLANSSGLVGRYFTEHPAISVYGRLDRRTNQEPIGFHTSESHQFYDHDDPQPGSFKLEFKNVNPPSPVSVALQGREGMRGALWGDDLLEHVQEEHAEKRGGT